MMHMNSITLGNIAWRVCSHVYVACRRSDRLPGGFNVPAGNKIETFCKVIVIETNSPRFNRDCALILGIGAAPAKRAVGEVSPGNDETRVTGETPRGPHECTQVGLTVMQARGRAIRAESFCESLGQRGPGRSNPDTRRARSAALNTKQAPACGAPPPGAG